jgi:hypothetical protein
MLIKKNFIAIFLILIGFQAFSQETEPTLVLYDFEGTDAPVYDNQQVNASTLNVYNYNLTSSNTPNYKFHNVQKTAKTDHYLYLQFGPISGRVLNLSKFIFDLGINTPNGVSDAINYELRTSLNSYQTILASGTGGAGQHIEIPLGNDYKSIPTQIEFRIYISNPNLVEDPGAVEKDVYYVDNIDIKGVAEIIPPTPLPVSMLFFDGKYNGTNINLKWATVSESFNDHFEIERSSDGVNFKKIGEVKGNGSTTTRFDYSFVDNGFKPVNYYRIKQVDLNGDNEYFRIIAISGSARIEAFVVNDVSGNNRVYSNEDNLDIKMYNSNGGLVLSKTLNKGYTDLNLNRSGFFVFLLSKGDYVKQGRVLLQ